jgi:hypothetical protein
MLHRNDVYNNKQLFKADTITNTSSDPTIGELMIDYDNANIYYAVSLCLRTLR